MFSACSCISLAVDGVKLGLALWLSQYPCKLFSTFCCTMAADSLVLHVCVILKKYYHLAKEHDEKVRVVPEEITKCLSAFGTLVYWLSIRESYHATVNPVLHSFAWDIHDSLIQMVGAATNGELSFFNVNDEMPPMHRQSFQLEQGLLRCELDQLPSGMAAWLVKKDLLHVQHMDRVSSAVILGMADFASALENVEPWSIPGYISKAFGQITKKVEERKKAMTSTMPPTLKMRTAHSQHARANVGACSGEEEDKREEDEELEDASERNRPSAIAKRYLVFF